MVSSLENLSVEQKQILKNLLKKYPKGFEKAAAIESLSILLPSRESALEAEILIKGISYFYGISSRILNEMMRNDLGHKKEEKRSLYDVKICSSLPCLLRGSGDIVKSCEKWLGIPCGGNTIDKRFSLNKEGCFNRCMKGPVVKINQETKEDLSPTKMIFWLQTLSEDEKKSSSVSRNPYMTMRNDE